MLPISSVTAQQRQIALPWLARLRWIAVVGQISATVLGVTWLDLHLPLKWIALVIAITAASNLALQVWIHFRAAPDWVAPAVIWLDVWLFTVLIGLSGGADNPFSILYSIHVAMAVVMLGGGWAWFIVLLSAASYGLVFSRHIDLTPSPPQWVWNLGQWTALVLVMGLIAYFIGKVMRSLRQREQELTQATERARRHEYLAALTTLAAGAAHELGTPLATIALVAKEMERAVDAASMMADDARLIRQEVERCRAILDRMRIDVLEDAGNRSAFETLNGLVEQLRADLREQERERLNIQTTEPGDEVIWRSRVLRRTLGALLRNAFDASGPEAPVDLLFQRREGIMIFQVRDCGAGMSQEVLRRAPEPFFTTKGPGSGMGLGLFLVRLVAEAYGGKFELKSAEGSGTQSILELPDHPRKDEFDGQDEEAEDSGGGRRRDLPQAVEPGVVWPRV